MSDTLCTKLWTDVYVTNPYHVGSCCRSYSTNAHSIVEFWNHKDITKVRVDMLAGRKNERCQFCYNLEDAGFKSIRTTINDVDISHELSLTDSNGKCSAINLKRVEVRFSNICNFKCRTCHGISSSALAVEQNDLEPVKYAFNNKYYLLDELIKYSDSLEFIKFSGGEPLLHAQHWELLETLLAQGKTNIVLGYNTNGSTLKFKGKIIFKLWRYFKHVELAVSLDAYGRKAEYWRHGTNWDTIVENLKLFKTRSGKITAGVHITVSWVNALSIKELVTFLETLDFAPASIGFSPVDNVFSLQSAPPKLKTIIEAELTSLNEKYPQIKSMIHHMYLKDSRSQFIDDIARLAEIDRVRGESFKTVFPEYNNLEQFIYE